VPTGRWPAARDRHRLLRRRRASHNEPGPFRLTETGRETLALWREREVPSYDKPITTVENDPTREPDADEIRPLEEEAGLTWEEARRQ